MKHFYYFTLLLLLMIPSLIDAQRNCATMEVLENMKATDPALEDRMQEIERHTSHFLQSDAVQSRTVITIPVVFHVVYRTTAENISEAQILSQLEVLNNDFSALNQDLSNIPAEFAGLIGNTEVEFCLATRDPNGNTTDGITRKQTNRTSWGTGTRIKTTSQGGVDPWDATQYLNIWVCNIGSNILGYAQFPGGSPATDGVVVDYRYLGTIGTATYPFNKGRTATHEVGHWLNLRHIWGDATCGNDLVDDTPAHNGSNTGCPSYPHHSTCAGNPLEMTMNYMDYTDDRCMYMFSAGQVARMRSVLAPGGFRASLLNSMGCQTGGGGGGGVTCNLPASLNATGITTNSATLTWGAVSGATAYNVRVRPIGSATWTNSTTSNTSTTATNLAPATSYEFQVQTVCGATTSANYASANFTTQQESGACSDIYESNNTQATAKSIQPGTIVQGLISSSSDQDWFSFTTLGSTKYIRVRLTSLPADYDLQLYRGTLLLATASNDGTLDEQILAGNRSPATHHVRVFGYNGANNPNDCYELMVELSASPFRESGAAVLEEVQDFSLFPNPTSGELILDIPVETETATQITIFDITGKQVHHSAAVLSKGNSITKMDVSNFANGMYAIRIQNGNFISTQKFIISK